MKMMMMMIVGLVLVVGRQIKYYFFVLPGDIHFDDGENWTLGSYRGINLTQVETSKKADSNWFVAMVNIPRWQFTRLGTVLALSIPT